MQYIVCPGRDAAFHLALEEYLLGCTGAYFFFWRSAPCVVIGKHQNAFQEVDTRYAEINGIPVFRRSSGGGAVYHDPGNVNFTFIKDLDPGTLVGYDAFLDPMAQALNKLGIPVRRKNKSDLFIDDGKISGNAQSVRRGRVLHHGTLLFDSDLSALEKLLFLPEHAMDSKGIRSNRSRVVNIRTFLPEWDVDTFQAALLQALFPGSLAEYALTPQDITAVHALSSERYTQWSWNYGRSPALCMQANELDAPSIRVENGRITQCDCSTLPAQACTALIGLEYRYTLLKETLHALPVLSGWSEQELSKLADRFFAGRSK